MRTDGKTTSFCLASASVPSFPPLPGPCEADVCVIGELPLPPFALRRGRRGTARTGGRAAGGGDAGTAGKN